MKSTWKSDDNVYFALIQVFTRKEWSLLSFVGFAVCIHLMCDVKWLCLSPACNMFQSPIVKIYCHFFHSMGNLVKSITYGICSFWKPSLIFEGTDIVVSTKNVVQEFLQCRHVLWRTMICLRASWLRCTALYEQSWSDYGCCTKLNL